MSVAEFVHDEVLDERLYRYRLRNGLPVLVHLKDGVQKKFALLAANYGSVDSSFVDSATGEEVTMPDGVAHFLEHKLFERREGDALALFSRRGAAANAATSFRSTSFFFSCSTNFRTNLRTLLQVVGDPWFSERSIEKERGIIAQEIRMYEDSPDWRAFMHLVRGLFVRHPVRVDITGTVESIGEIDRETLLTCYRNFYDPANLCLVVSGAVDPDEVAAVAERELGDGGGRPVVRVRPKEPAGVAKARVEETAAVPRGKMLLGFKDTAVPVDGPALLRRDQLTGILLDLMFGASSETYLRLYENGEIDDSFYTSYAGEEDFGFLTIGTESDEAKRSRAALMREVRKFGREGFTTEDFGRVIHKSMGRFVRSLDSQETVAFLLLASTFRGVDPFRIPTMIRTMRPEDVMARHGELFGPRNHSTSFLRAP